MIFFFILITCLLDIVLILWWEIPSWSLMGVERCNPNPKHLMTYYGLFLMFVLTFCQKLRYIRFVTSRSENIIQNFFPAVAHFFSKSLWESLRIHLAKVPARHLIINKEIWTRRTINRYMYSNIRGKRDYNCLQDLLSARWEHGKF